MSAGNSSTIDRSVGIPPMKPVSVKALVEFAAKSGSLDRKFTPGPTALEGIEGHKRVADNRSGNYQTEISFSAQYRDLLIRGRADGYQPDTNCIEEIKTFYGNFDKISENHRVLHWAQAKMYGWMLCTEYKKNSVTLALVYFQLGDQTEHRLEKVYSADELENYCLGLIEKYYRWQKKINARLSNLYLWADRLNFPYPELHPSQRQMAEAVYKAAATGKVLLAEAPTGTGKTLAGIFPAIKAFTKTPVDKIFYLTAKTTGKQLALENIQLIATDSTNTPLRALELTAQEKACLEPEKRCAGDSCIYADQFYTKLSLAREAAYEIPILDKNALALLAHQYKICPFYLGMEMSRWVDIVVADYNYYFDYNGLLFALTKEFNWKPYLLVDESHNLVDRGRGMYTASLNRGTLLAAKQQAPVAIKRTLTRINKIWLDVLKNLEFKADALTVLPKLPEQLPEATAEFATQYIELLQKQPDHPVQHTVVQEFFFDVLHFKLIQDIINDDFCIDMQNPESKREQLTLRNLSPASFLAVRLDAAHSACFFSATLQPAYFFQALLGLPVDCVHIQLASPFCNSQLNIKFASNLSTRFRDRPNAIRPICDIIKNQLTSEPGNALIFFSSYDFLQQTEKVLEPIIQGLNLNVITQSRNMNEGDRQLFIQQFTANNNVLGLAVLGGAFSEGVDLPGDALKGVFIATLGLPQVNPTNEYMRAFMQHKFQQGYDFTYFFPGIQKVIQAAGRVIRTPRDKGYVWLLDERFSYPQTKKLLPSWWKLP